MAEGWLTRHSLIKVLPDATPQTRLNPQRLAIGMLREKKNHPRSCKADGSERSAEQGASAGGQGSNAAREEASGRVGAADGCGGSAMAAGHPASRYVE